MFEKTVIRILGLLLCATVATSLVACLGQPPPDDPIVTLEVTGRRKEFTDASLVAFQDGTSGIWQALESSYPGIYQFPVSDTEGRFSVAVACQGEELSINLIHATTTEIQQLASQCVLSKETHSLEGAGQSFVTIELAHLTPGYKAFVYVWGDKPLVLDQDGATTAVPVDDSATLLVIEAEERQRGRFDASSIHQFYVANIDDFQDPYLLDLADEALVSPPLEAAVVATNANTDQTHTVTGNVTLKLPKHVRLQLGTSVITDGGTATLSYKGIPASLTGRLHERLFIANLTETGPELEGIRQVRNTTRYFPDPESTPQLAVSFAQHLFGNGDLTTSYDAGESVSTASWDSYPGAQAYTVSLLSPKADTNKLHPTWQASFTPGWLGEQPTYSYAFSELLEVEGWQEAWSQEVLEATSWQIGALQAEAETGEDAPLKILLGKACKDGVGSMEIRMAGREGSRVSSE
ncbi:MAG: hypothetical protein JSV66_18310 [Trueperaceae bacterium]|nr:MAG: hypothetical protein JSV66_18310 [Trueperaceae bacterium]